MKEVARRQLVLWIYRSRIRRFLFFFPIFTLISYLVHGILLHFEKSDLGWYFPLFLGIAMGINFAFWLPKSVAAILQRAE